MLYSGERKRGNKEQTPKERLSQVASRKATVAQLHWNPVTYLKSFWVPNFCLKPSLMFEVQKVGRWQKYVRTRINSSWLQLSNKAVTESCYQSKYEELWGVLSNTVWSILPPFVNLLLPKYFGGLGGYKINIKLIEYIKIILQTVFET